jgi:membrane-associated phospholipid phosphatase
MRLFVTFSNMIALVLLLLVLAAQPIFGQDAPETAPLKITEFRLFPPAAAAEEPFGARQFVHDVWKDQKAIWTRTPRMTRRQFFTIALPLAAATAGLIATDERAARWLPNTPDQLKWSGRVSKVGAAYTLGGLAGGLILTGKFTRKAGVSRIGWISAEALANALLTSYAIKGVTVRERPDQGNGEGRFWHGGFGFPSGHAMDSWAVATAVARSPKCPRWLAISSYSLAAGISLSRWGAQKHFPSDILVGAAMGGFIGNYVARRPR